MKISNDSFAILLICSDIGINKSDDWVKPYTVSQWSKLAEKLRESKLTPNALFDVPSENIKTALGLSKEELTRIDRLLSRSGQLSIELSALHDKGIFMLTRADSKYPAALKKKLKKLAPPILYYAGNLSLIVNKGVSIVGSRDIDEAAKIFTQKLSKRCTDDGINIVSGGARGVDSIAENIANNAEGTTIVVVADSLEKKIRRKETREAITRRQSLVLSSFRPDMPFQAYAAMERNKYVYALSDFVVVVSSDYKKGGTWAGAQENLKHQWTPMFVRKADDMPPGNIHLLNNGNVHAITDDVFEKQEVNVFDWFTTQIKNSEGKPVVSQPGLFG